jgi:hypothetical protein
VTVDDEQVEPIARITSNAAGVTDAIIGGWQVNGIYTLQRGFPLTITAADAGGLNDRFGTNRADLVGDPFLRDWADSTGGPAASSIPGALKRVEESRIRSARRPPGESPVPCATRPDGTLAVNRVQLPDVAARLTDRHELLAPRL